MLLSEILSKLSLKSSVDYQDYSELRKQLKPYLRTRQQRYLFFKKHPNCAPLGGLIDRGALREETPVLSVGQFPAARWDERLFLPYKERREVFGELPEELHTLPRNAHEAWVHAVVSQPVTHWNAAKAAARIGRKLMEHSQYYYKRWEIPEEIPSEFFEAVLEELFFSVLDVSGALSEEYAKLVQGRDEDAVLDGETFDEVVRALFPAYGKLPQIPVSYLAARVFERLSENDVERLRKAAKDEYSYLRAETEADGVIAQALRKIRLVADQTGSEELKDVVEHAEDGNGEDVDDALLRAVVEEEVTRVLHAVSLDGACELTVSAEGLMVDPTFLFHDVLGFDQTALHVPQENLELLHKTGNLNHLAAGQYYPSFAMEEFFRGPVRTNGAVVVDDLIREAWVARIRNEVEDLAYEIENLSYGWTTWLPEQKHLVLCRPHKEK